MNEKTNPQRIMLQDSHRLSFLLRLWRTEGSRGSDWRASVEIPETGQRIGFASLEQLFAFLMEVSENNNKIQSTENQ